MSEIQHKVEMPVGEVWDWPLQHDNGVVHLQNNPGDFQVDLECSEYNVNEIQVKTINDEIIIHCAHAEKVGKMGDRVRREVQRAYRLPSDCDPATMKATLDKKGHLQIRVSKKH